MDRCAPQSEPSFGKDAAAMTREQKLSLIIGFSLVLLVGVLVSDHLSGARTAQLADVGAALEKSAPPPLAEPLPEYDDPEPVAIPLPAIAAAPEPSAPERTDAARTDESTSESFLRSLQEQFRETGVSAPVAARIESREIPLPEPRVVDPVVEDQRPAAVETYRVRKGDSLWSIAQEHYGDGHLAKKLAEFNVVRGRLRDADTILVGATILLPEPRVLGAPGSRAVATSEPARPREYTVRKGDTLGEIAQRELGSSKRWEAIVAANKRVINDPDDIRVGMVLRIPS